MEEAESQGLQWGRWGAGHCVPRGWGDRRREPLVHLSLQGAVAGPGLSPERHLRSSSVRCRSEGRDEASRGKWGFTQPLKCSRLCLRSRTSGQPPRSPQTRVRAPHRQQAWGSTPVHGARQQDVRASSDTGSRTCRLNMGGTRRSPCPFPRLRWCWHFPPCPLWAHGPAREGFSGGWGRRRHASRPRGLWYTRLRAVTAEATATPLTCCLLSSTGRGLVTSFQLCFPPGHGPLEGRSHLSPSIQNCGFSLSFMTWQCQRTQPNGPHVGLVGCCPVIKFRRHVPSLPSAQVMSCLLRGHSWATFGLTNDMKPDPGGFQSFDSTVMSLSSAQPPA